MVDIDKIKSSWKSRGFSCDLWADEPDQRWENYVHKTDELFMIISGKVELEIAGKIIHPGIGEEVFIPARQNHSVRNIGNTRSKWLYGYKN